MHSIFEWGGRTLTSRGVAMQVRGATRTPPMTRPGHVPVSRLTPGGNGERGPRGTGLVRVRRGQHRSGGAPTAGTGDGLIADLRPERRPIPSPRRKAQRHRPRNLGRACIQSQLRPGCRVRHLGRKSMPHCFLGCFTPPHLQDRRVAGCVPSRHRDRRWGRQWGDWAIQVGAFLHPDLARAAADNARLVAPDLLQAARLSFP